MLFVCITANNWDINHAVIHNVALQLNRSNEYFPFEHGWSPFYKEYVGIKNHKLFQLLSEGRIPLSFADILERRLDISRDSEPIRSSWMDNSFDSSDFIVYSSYERKFKIVFSIDNKKNITADGKKLFNLINFKSVFVKGYTGLVDKFEEIQGVEFNQNPFDFLYCQMLSSSKEVLKNKLWKILSRHPEEVPSYIAKDKNLLKRYSSLVFFQTKLKFNRGMNMNVLLGNPKMSCFLPWKIGPVFCSIARGDSYCYNEGGRFVGFKSNS